MGIVISHYGAVIGGTMLLNIVLMALSLLLYMRIVPFARVTPRVAQVLYFVFAGAFAALAIFLLVASSAMPAGNVFKDAFVAFAGHVTWIPLIFIFLNVRQAVHEHKDPRTRIPAPRHEH